MTFSAHRTKYTVIKQNKSSPMNPTWTPGVRLHEHRQAFQATDIRQVFPGTPLSVPGDRQQIILPLALLSMYQGTDLSVPGHRRQTILPLVPLSVYQGADDRQSFPWHRSQCTRGQTTDNPSPGTPLSVPGDRQQTILSLAPLSVYQGTDDRRSFPWYPSQSTKGQTAPGT